MKKILSTEHGIMLNNTLFYHECPKCKKINVAIFEGEKKNYHRLIVKCKHSCSKVFYVEDVKGKSEPVFGYFLKGKTNECI